MARNRKDEGSGNQGKMSLSEAGRKGGEATKRKQSTQSSSESNKQDSESHGRQR